jgi:hypothetical protein
MRAIVSAVVSLLFIVATGAASAQDAGLSHPDYRTLHELGTKVHADVNKAVDAFAARQEKPSAALLADYEALLKRAAQVADAIGRSDQSLVGRIRRGLVTQGGEGLAEARQGLAENDNDKIRRGLNRMSNAWSVPLARLAPK